ncbi:sn-glycerol-3-phosphate ABC transporter substrate-binding protein [Skermanella stibiiresistens SB22]|uniref:sn-glycerol-3-phosphate-binding periplasmic protein UgpB n=1 Tax=Skermanella stibiiresistens SB22 TaxID=1385369 RepID=W9H440_9PROT|nr:sn-glycerol-3-phosphate ABC transporter substrate-binding protein UgpB [Skermanella stibiiresistens]EWY40975.1 sn-glycerol-3-phosphate ABC transporter substrate-binding protein [Skermanella stibiiresistens SB22]
MQRIHATIAVSAFALLAMTLTTATPARAQTEIQWWHAMSGANNETVENLAKEFNATQTEFKVVPVYKGTYPETLNAGIAAFRARQPPHIIQVFDVGTGVMMGARSAIKPVADVLKEAGQNFDKSNYLSGIVSYYSAADGTMLSFPFNSSSPILYYNKASFRKAGLDPEAPPKTWPETFEAAKKIKASGQSCGMTTTWPTWIHLENFSAWNNLPYATGENGLTTLTPELKINSPLNIRHFQTLAELQKDGTFQYGGRTSEAKSKFLSGECAMMPESSGGIGDMVKAGMDFGTGNLPYYPEATGAPQNTIPGGASLWVFAGKPAADYKGVAQFFTFLSTTEVQSRLHQVSGYLPATMAAYEATKKSGFYEKNPGREIPIQQMMGKAPTENSKGVRLVNMPQVRDIQNEEIEALLNGKQDAKTALDNAVRRSNAAILEAAKAYQ